MRVIWLRALVVVWCACVAVAVCGCGRGTDIFGRPNPVTPLEKRPIAEQYIADVEPAIQRFVEALAKQNGGALGFDGTSYVGGCGERDGDHGWEVASPIFKVMMTSALDLRTLSDQYLEPAGFTPPDTFAPSKERSLSWMRSQDGTFINVYYVPGKELRFFYRSGCRPQTGSDVDALDADVHARDLSQTFPDLVLYQSFDADGNPQGPPDQQSGATAQSAQSGGGQ